MPTSSRSDSSRMTRTGFLAGGLATAAALATRAQAAEITPEEQANLDLVTRFCQAFAQRDIEKLRPFLAEDFRYRLAEFSQWQTGEAGYDAMRTYVDTSDTIDFEILDSWSRGPIVVNERIDHFTGQRKMDIHLTGVFFVRNGKIQEWSDYNYRPR